MYLGIFAADTRTAYIYFKVPKSAVRVSTYLPKYLPPAATYLSLLLIMSYLLIQVSPLGTRAERAWLAVLQSSNEMDSSTGRHGGIRFVH